MLDEMKQNRASAVPRQSYYNAKVHSLQQSAVLWVSRADGQSTAEERGGQAAKVIWGHAAAALPPMNWRGPTKCPRFPNVAWKGPAGPAATILVSLSTLYLELYNLNTTHPSDHSHLCLLKCHLIFFSYRLGLTSVHLTCCASLSIC